jgi:hypothetical protein
VVSFPPLPDALLLSGVANKPLLSVLSNSRD